MVKAVAVVAKANGVLKAVRVVVAVVAVEDVDMTTTSRVKVTQTMVIGMMVAGVVDGAVVEEEEGRSDVTHVAALVT